ncbi:MAG TPA: choice-of-anchor tandem repeat GloVer-containing protein, partial [Chryseolinea sp.]
NFGNHLINPGPINLKGSDGFLYGLGGSVTGAGIFKVRPDGTEYQQILSFKGGDWTGEGFTDGTMVLKDGVIYGSTHLGGEFLSGVVYSVNEDGTNYQRLHNFTYPISNLPRPATMVLGLDGKLYGTHHVGGGYGGNIYAMMIDGTGFREVLDFNAVGMREPQDLIQGADQKLYGLGLDESNGWPMLFRVNNDGTAFELLHVFSHGDSPAYGIRQAVDGTIYGAIVNGDGAIFTCLPDGTDYRIIHNFSLPDGRVPSGKIVQGADGLLYGRTRLGGSNGMGTTFRIKLDGSAFEVLTHSTLGGTSSVPIVEDPGVIFGFTSGGGQFNGGTLYTIDSGLEKVVYDFGAPNLAEAYAGSGPIEADGNILTMGKPSSPLSSTMITALKKDKSFITYSLLDDESANGPLQPVLAPDGFLYSVYAFGGDFHTGILFKCKPDGSSYSVVHNFSPSGGAHPVGPVVVGSDGRLYGNCFQGGNSNFGVIYAINPDGTGYTVLHHFNFPTGEYPQSGLVQSSDGTLFGSASNLFSIRPDGTNYKELQAFQNNEMSNAELTLESGYLYGTVRLGGSNSKGAIFRMKMNGSDYTILHNFNGTDGAAPASTLLPYAGALYGTASDGGAFGFGTVYKIDISNGGFTKIIDLSLKTGGSPVGSLMGVCVPADKPIVTVSGTTLISNASLGNQWFRDGTIIAGANGATYEPSSAGVYSVAAGFSGCVSPLSDGVMVNVTGIESESSQGLVKFFPNPTENLLFIDANTHTVIEDVSISDTMGNVIANHEGVAGPEWHYDMSQHSRGVYIIKAFVNGRQTSAKVIRN